MPFILGLIILFIIVLIGIKIVKRRTEIDSDDYKDILTLVEKIKFVEKRTVKNKMLFTKEPEFCIKKHYDEVMYDLNKLIKKDKITVNEYKNLLDKMKRLQLKEVKNINEFEENQKKEKVKEELKTAIKKD